MFDTISWFGSGAAGSSALDKSKNLADVANPQQALDNLGGASKAELEALQDSVDAKADVSDVSGLMLSKLGAGQLWFNRGVLSVPSFANLSISLPLSLCIEYEVDSWEGLGSGDGSGIMFFATRDAEYVTPAVYRGFYLYYHENGRFGFRCGNPRASEESWSTNIFEIRNTAGLPAGRHTLVACIGGEISAGKPTHYALYLDGVEIAATVIFQSLASADITSARVLSIGQSANYSNPSYAGGAKIPIKLSRAQMFNFLIDDTGSPYAVADYAAGKPVPPKFYDPAAAQRALLALEDYTIARNTTTRLVKDISGNAYDATVVESGGSGDTAWTGTVKGSRDSAVAAFVDEIKTQINQSNG